MTILDPNYPLYAALQAKQAFDACMVDIEQRSVNWEIQKKKDEVIGKQLNRRWLLQKIFYKLRRENEK